MNFLKCAAIIISLAIMPSNVHAEAGMVSFETWESVCRPSADVPSEQARDCFASAIEVYLVDFAPLVYSQHVELHCEDSVDYFWSEFDKVTERMIDFMMNGSDDWSSVVSQAIFYSGTICPDISQ